MAGTRLFKAQNQAKFVRSKRFPAIATVAVIGTPGNSPRKSPVRAEDTASIPKESTESNRDSIRLWAVLTLIISLAMMAILSKKHFANAWEYVTVLIVIASVALYFRRRIVRFGPYVFAAILVVILATVVLFGI